MEFAAIVTEAALLRRRSCCKGGLVAEAGALTLATLPARFARLE